MAESIAIHFPNTSWQEIEAVLKEVARPGKKVNEQIWAYPANGDHQVLLYSGGDLRDYEAKDLEQLRDALGTLPRATLLIELRRSKGADAVDSAEKLASLFLSRFSGLADDSLGGLWSLSEIKERAKKKGMIFLDAYRKQSTKPDARTLPAHE